jgi:TRAP-type uncharacterized transport system substrate-binding protein
MKKLTVLALAAAAMYLPTRAHAQDAISYCTGSAGGNYAFTGIAIKQQLPKHVDLVATAGSLENMEKVASGTCQAGIVQSDAFFVYLQTHPDAQLTVERARDMYPEYGHLICNKTIREISDLKRGNTVLVGPAGSGSAVMWDAIVRANPKYKDVATLPMGGTRALGKVSDGEDAQCMLFVAGLKAQSMMDANGIAKTSNGNLHLTYMRDPALFDIKDKRGRPLYERSAIPSGTYPGGLQASGWFTSGGAVDTVKVQSVLIDNVDYANSHEANLNLFLNAVNKALPAIDDHVLPK